jgi:hypothetical protein
LDISDIDITKKDEWVVLKKFHLIKGGFLPLSFFYKGKNGKSKKIILTDNLHQLSKSTQFENLDFEETKNLIVELTKHLDNIETLYDNVLKEYNLRNNG